MTDVRKLLDQQVSYYRSIAREYDALATEYMHSARQAVTGLLQNNRLHGHVVEFACGTGLWTSVLSELVDHVTAVDVAPEMLRIARDRMLPNVEFVQADLFSWVPTAQWDGAFFANWHSHVPSEQIPSFWSTVDRAVRHGGPVVFLDATAPDHDDGIEEDIRDPDVPLVRRWLSDGRSFDIVKTYWEPQALLTELASLGWRGSARELEMPGTRNLVLYNMKRSDSTTVNSESPGDLRTA